MSKESENKVLNKFLPVFIVSYLFDIKLVLVAMIVLPFYLKYRNRKKELEAFEEERSNKRDTVILAKIKDIEIDCKWGENSYCVLCEYWSGSETFMFRSMPVKYELNLSVGQEIEVMVEENDLSNYYVMLNEYIILPDKKEGHKVGGMYFMSEDVWGRSKEKQILAGCLAMGYMIYVMILLAMGIKKIISLTQMRALGLLGLAVIYVVKKQVDW